ncbi:hypothetical protein D9M73_141560 [compost metagenome]
MPSFMALAMPAMSATTLSKCLRCTYNREPAQQTWPWLKKIALAAPAAALARSASAMTMVGDLPPSSRVTRVMESMAALPICLPTSVEPVKVSLSTSGLWVSAEPALMPVPVTTLNTPLG